MASEADQFSADLAAATGLDPRVIKAWTIAEGAYAKNGTGGHNYLNLRVHGGGVGYSGVTEGSSPAGFAQFNSVKDAETETAYWLNRFPNYAGIRATAGQSPEAQIKAIEASPWDAGNYAGDKIGAIFRLSKPSFDLSGVANTVGGAVSSEAGAIASDRFYPGGQQGSIGQAADNIDSVGKALSFVLSYRFLEIVGGGLLVIIGLVGLMREVGVSVPAPLQAVAAVTPVGRAAEVAGPISSQPRRVQRRAGFEPQSPERDRREESVKRRQMAKSGGPGDTIPF